MLTKELFQVSRRVLFYILEWGIGASVVIFVRAHTQLFLRKLRMFRRKNFEFRANLNQELVSCLLKCGKSEWI